MKVILLLGSVAIFVLTSACCGGDYWLETYTGNYGIWRECSEIIGAFTRTCQEREVKIGDHALKSQRSLTILATVASAVAAIIAFICIFTTMIRPAIASACLFLGSMATCIALSIFTYQNHEETTRLLASSSFGWSWYLGWVAVGIGVLVAPLGMCCQPKRDQGTVTRNGEQPPSKRYTFEKEVKFTDQTPPRVQYTTRRNSQQHVALPASLSYSNGLTSSNEYV